MSHLPSKPLFRCTAVALKSDVQIHLDLQSRPENLAEVLNFLLFCIKLDIKFGAEALRHDEHVPLLNEPTVCSLFL